MNTIVTIRMPSSMSSPSNCSSKKPSWCGVFDPESKFIHNCNHFLLFICLLSLYIDPLLLFVPIAKDSGSINIDFELGVSVAIIRTIADFFLFSGMVLKFRTAFANEDRTFRLFGKRELVKEPKTIAIRYLKSSFIIDLLACLPLPQVYMSYQRLVSNIRQATDVYYDISAIFQAQFVPRILVACFVYNKIEKTTGIAIRSPLSGTLYILFVYGMLSHYAGALYYCLFINNLVICRAMAFRKATNGTMVEIDQLAAQCYQRTESEQGLTSEAFANKIGSRSFSQKYMFCFSWGLKTLSSMGQNLSSSISLVDTSFNLIIVIIGLMLFADLIARMQTCMQSVGEQEEQQMVRQRDLEDWANSHQLPPYLKKRVQQTVQADLRATRGIDNQAILDSLPVELRCEIQRHLYLGLVHDLPIFEEMDDQLLHAICGHLRTFTGAEGRYIFLEGDPVLQLLFIFSGQLEMFSIESGSSSHVGPGGLCGQELLAWSSLANTSPDNLPSSTYTVKCLTDVEAFSLLAKDVKLLAINFDHDKKLFDALSRHSSHDL